MGVALGASRLEGVVLTWKGKDAPTLGHPREGFVQGQDAPGVEHSLGEGKTGFYFLEADSEVWEAWSEWWSRTVSGHVEKARTKPQASLGGCVRLHSLSSILMVLLGCGELQGQHWIAAAM